MNRLTYKEAYDKIIEAYFKDEIKPFNSEFCFCGTLSKNVKWNDMLVDNPFYSYGEYKKMEWALFTGTLHWPKMASFFCLKEYVGKDSYEEYLFKGMSAALDVLKEIHRQRGENVDEDFPQFTKRNLEKVFIG